MKSLYTNIFLLVVFVLAIWYLLRTVGILDSFQGETAAERSMNKVAAFLRKRKVRLPNRGSE